MRSILPGLVMLALMLAAAMPVFAETTEDIGSKVDLQFSGYKFGQEPAANMVCLSGYCKSQAPGGDGRVTFPYSIYGTPGAVSTLAALTIVNPRYTFWNDCLYRVFFQVNCAPLEQDECLDDIVNALDREYTLTPLSASETRQFVRERHVIIKEFVTESGGIIKIRATSLAEGPQMPMVDIVDKEMANQVGLSLSPNFKPKKPDLPEDFQKP